MNKILLVVLIIVVLGAGGYFAWQYLGGEEPTENACIGEGGLLPPEGSEVVGVCCAGLNKIKDNKSMVPLPEGGCSGQGSDAYICAPCGDGVCGEYENQCNCPEDCEPEVSNINWNDLIPQIREAIGSLFLDMAIYPDQAISIDQIEDITGDGIPEALVNASTGGAATVGLILMRLENNEPVLANFKKSDGSVSPINFLAGGGGSGRYGESTEMLPDKNAISAGHYMAYGNVDSDYCKAEAYRWNAQTKTFDYSAELSSEIQKTYCAKICSSLEEMCDGHAECLSAGQYICP